MHWSAVCHGGSCHIRVRTVVADQNILRIVSPAYAISSRVCISDVAISGISNVSLSGFSPIICLRWWGIKYMLCPTGLESWTSGQCRLHLYTADCVKTCASHASACEYSCAHLSCLDTASLMRCAWKCSVFVTTLTSVNGSERPR